jgi:hypothetical protein
MLNEVPCAPAVTSLSLADVSLQCIASTTQNILSAHTASDSSTKAHLRRKKICLIAIRALFACLADWPTVGHDISISLPSSNSVSVLLLASYF